MILIIIFYREMMTIPLGNDDKSYLSIYSNCQIIPGDCGN